MMAQKIDTKDLPEISVVCDAPSKRYSKMISSAVNDLQDIICLDKIVAVVLLSDNCVFYGPEHRRLHDSRKCKPAFPVESLGEFSDCFTTIYQGIPQEQLQHIFFFYDSFDIETRIKNLRSNCDYTKTFQVAERVGNDIVFKEPS